MSSLTVVVLAAMLCYVTANIDPTLCKLDMVLSLDNSGSIGVLPDGSPDTTNPPANWKLVTDFCKDIVDQLTISPTNSQVGLVDFSRTARAQFTINQYQTKSALDTAIDQVPYIGGRTNTTGGIRVARQLLTTATGPRPGISKVVVLITDGIPNEDADLVYDEAQYARDAGIRVIVVGITKEADEVLMRKLAYTPNDYVYANDFSDLDTIKDVVLNDESCKFIPPVAATTTAAPVPATTTQPPVTTTTAAEIIC